MAQEHQRLSAAERDNLVAYLDGELAEAEARTLEAKLTQSVSARREVEALEKTWELLDFLPRPKASPELTARTLSQAAHVASPDEQLLGAAKRTARRVGRVVVCAAMILATLGLGYASTRWLWPNPTVRLARRLSLAEFLDEYRTVGRFEFLKQLDESGVFDTDADAD
jgi:anti-sigma factor RsiW